MISVVVTGTSSQRDTTFSGCPDDRLRGSSRGTRLAAASKTDVRFTEDAQPRVRQT
jgi:hypothetical protein